MNIYEIIFIIAAILVGGGGTFYFGSGGQYIAAVIFLILAILTFVVFGLRWFGPQGALAQTTTNWPPALNTCPDYLTFYNRVKANSATPIPSCVDTLGVSVNNSLKVFPADGNVNPDDDSYFFALIAGETRAATCARLTQYGLTWEGIFDGESCLSSGSGTPTGPGAAGGGAGGAGGSCPQ
jgi:hypothetical protein